MKRSRGFTLLEVAVAIAVVAIGLIGAFNAIIQSADATARLRERALADWIAMNQISTMRLSGEFPEVDEYDGDVEFAGRAWYWSATVSETGVEDLRRIDMNVAWEETPDDPVTIMCITHARLAAVQSSPHGWNYTLSQSTHRRCGGSSRARVFETQSRRSPAS